MSIQVILQAIEKLTNIHISLLEVSKEKTASIKEGKIDQLQTILVKERKDAQILEQTEAKRLQLVDQWFQEKGIHAEATISTMLDYILDETEKQQLVDATTALTNMITKLKQQEQLNQALIQQSMQFVEISLDMLNPSLKRMNYGAKRQTTVPSSESRSVFDSKA
ncbi:flagellar protein FlgN [Oceanobacillus halotolerans]|uniref:flagellar protein FlgN n=1 Tax=Oceanobacillus halotolerans TaxID=2663380 RepID=UPI0013D9A8F8|nr:flagellar protein FlgN [Oceanobacillus halotolerans]